MNSSVSSIYYSPVKSLSFESVNLCMVKKKLGIQNDRIFAFSRGLNFEESKLIEKDPNKRKLKNFLTLKNSPVLNKYQFTFNNSSLTLNLDNKEIITVSTNSLSQIALLSEKLIELEDSLIKPINLLQNDTFPFFDTSHSNNIFNSISLINLNSITDFESKINQKVEFQRFRGNFYVDGIDPWIERNWINKVVKINNISFKVEKNIPRCVAINIKPKTDDNSLNLLQLLKKTYNHFDMGIYLTPLDDGKIEIGNKIEL